MKVIGSKETGYKVESSFNAAPVRETGASKTPANTKTTKGKTSKQAEPDPQAATPPDDQ